MKATCRILFICVPIAYLFYSKYLYLSSSQTGDVARYVEFFNSDSSTFSFEAIFLLFHHLVSTSDMNPILIFSIIGSLCLSLIIVKSGALICSYSGSIVGLFILTVFAILPPESSLFSTFLSAWRFLYGFLFLVLGTLSLKSTRSRLATARPYKFTNLMSSIFFVLAAISHVATLVLSFILFLVYFRGHFIDSLLSLLYRLKLRRFSFARVKAFSVVFCLMSLLFISRLALTDYFSARISHYSDFSTFDGSYSQALFSVVLSYVTSLCIVSFSYGGILGPLAKAYAVLPVLLVPLLLVSPASAYRLSSQYYFLGFICLSYVSSSAFVRFYCRRAAIPRFVLDD
jgi:hypothetical protein